MSTPILDIRRLSLGFRTPGGFVQALDDVSFRVDDGQVVGLVGESGSGKSVTALSILRLLPAGRAIHRGGEILYRGEDLLVAPESRLARIRGKSIGIVFQTPGTSLNPLIRIGDQVGEVLELHRGLDGADRAREAARLLEAVELPPWVARAHPHELSGGMQQRAAIAIAIACHPDLLIADEPTSSLDVSVQAQIVELLRDLHRRRLIRAILFITHDFGLVDELCDRVTVMYAGQIAETGATDAILRRPAHPYTRGLLAAIPRLGPSVPDVVAIPGGIPDLVAPPAGCRFHPRCALARADCRAARPPLAGIATDHRAACHALVQREPA